MPARDATAHRAGILRGIGFRVCSPDDVDLGRSAASSREDPGRFNTESVAAVYLSREPDTAFEELRRVTEREGSSLTDAHPCMILAVDLCLSDVVDFTRPDALLHWGLSAEDLTADDMRRCREVAEAIADRGAEGIRWPSATGRGQSLAVFLERLRPDSRIEVSKALEITCDELTAIARGASARELFGAIADLPLIAER